MLGADLSQIAAWWASHDITGISFCEDTSNNVWILRQILRQSGKQGPSHCAKITVCIESSSGLFADRLQFFVTPTGVTVGFDDHLRWLTEEVLRQLVCQRPFEVCDVHRDTLHCSHKCCSGQSCLQSKMSKNFLPMHHAVSKI